MHIARKRVATETYVIMAIGLADLISTIVLIQRHGAQEANPLFRRYWEMGPTAFIVAKMLCLAGPLFVLEWARRRRPRFTAWALRGAIAGYLMMYVIGFIHLNHPLASGEPAGLPPPPSPIEYMALAARYPALFWHAHRVHRSPTLTAIPNVALQPAAMPGRAPLSPRPAATKQDVAVNGSLVGF